VGCCLLKYPPQVCLTFAVELVHYFRPAQMSDMGICLIGNCTGDESLPASGGTVQKDPLGRINAQSFKDLWIFQGKLYHLTNSSDFLAQPPNILVRDSARPDSFPDFFLALNIYDCFGMYQRHPSRRD